MAKIIWQATKDKLLAENEISIIKQRIHTKRLPSSFGLLDHSIDNIEQMLKQPTFNEDKRATLSYLRLKTIAQFKYNMLILAITTAQEVTRNHRSIVTGGNGQVALAKTLIELNNTITAHQTNFVQRNELILQQKLSVFDGAPMVI